MKTRHLFRTLLVAITALLMAATDSMAQGKPWAKLQDGVLTFSFGAKPAAATAVKCPECGKMVAVNQNFCPNCGTKKPVAGTIFEVPLNIKGSENAPWYNKRKEVKKVVFAPSFKKATNITSTSYWFYYMGNLTTIIGLENLNTTNVTDMCGMFNCCESLTSLNLSSFNTSKVTDMGHMFSGCKSLTSLNLSSFNTSKVTDMSSMFSGCESLTSLNLSSFNTDKVYLIASIFSNCTSLKTIYLPANSWDIEKIKRNFQEGKISGETKYNNLAPAKDLYENCPAQLIRK